MARIEPDARADPPEIEGLWKLVQMETGGVFPEHKVGSQHLFYQGEIDGQGWGLSWRYTVREGMNPKQIDLIRRTRNTIDTKKGIYKKENDRLTICTSPTSRPDRFETRAGSDRGLAVYVNVSEPPDPDFSKMVGHWIIRKTTKVPLRSMRNIRNGRLTIQKLPFRNRGNGHIQSRSGETFRFEVSAVDSGMTPGVIDVRVSHSFIARRVSRREHVDLEGVYRMDGDKITMVFGRQGDRPAQVRINRGANAWLLDLHRDKP